MVMLVASLEPVFINVFVLVCQRCQLHVFLFLVDFKVLVHEVAFMLSVIDLFLELSSVLSH